MAGLLRVYDCDAGITVNDVKYDILDHDGVTYTHNLVKHLGRGANGTNKKGYVYQEGTKTADLAELTVRDCSMEFYKMVKNCHDNNTRIEFWFLDRKTGEGYTYKQALISQKPRQTTITDDEASMSFVLAVESFDVKEKFADDEA